MAQFRKKPIVIAAVSSSHDDIRDGYEPTYCHNVARAGVKEWWQITPDELAPDEHWPIDPKSGALCEAAVKKTFWSWKLGDFTSGLARCSHVVHGVKFCTNHAMILWQRTAPVNLETISKRINKVSSKNKVRLDPAEAFAHYGREFSASWDAETDLSSALRAQRLEDNYESETRLYQRPEVKRWPWSYLHTRPRPFRHQINLGKPADHFGGR